MRCQCARRQTNSFIEKMLGGNGVLHAIVATLHAAAATRSTCSSSALLVPLQAKSCVDSDVLHQQTGQKYLTTTNLNKATCGAVASVQARADGARSCASCAKRDARIERSDPAHEPPPRIRCSTDFSKSHQYTLAHHHDALPAHAVVGSVCACMDPVLPFHTKTPLGSESRDAAQIPCIFHLCVHDSEDRAVSMSRGRESIKESPSMPVVAQP
jgi:hypothetical protein